jgi:thioredoxin 1
MSKPAKVTTQSFDADVLQSDIPVVVDFWAPWCGPCRLIAPVLSELAPQYDGKVKIAKVNVDEEPSLASRWRISGIPTLLVFKGGKVVKSQVGFPGAGPLKDLFSEVAGGDKRYRVSL